MMPFILTIAARFGLDRHHPCPRRLAQAHRRSALRLHWAFPTHAMSR